MQWQEYLQFFSYGQGGILGIVVVFGLHLLIHFFAVAMSFYLAFTLTSRFTEKNEGDTKAHFKILAVIIGAALLSSFCGKIISTRIFMTISKRLHDATVKSLLASHISFFEQHTHGHILNRFTSDIKTLDNFVFQFLEMIDYFIKCLTAVTIVLYLYPVMFIFAFPSLVYLAHMR